MKASAITPTQHSPSPQGLSLQASSQTPAFENNRHDAIQFKEMKDITHNSPRTVAQRQAFDEAFGDSSANSKPNSTGMPDTLKTGLESYSGIDLSDVKVHYNSSRPAQLQALAYAQGKEIHLGPGQEKHLPHEGWHVVQQRQGRVKPTSQMKGGVYINDNDGLEREADAMGAKAMNVKLEPVNYNELDDVGVSNFQNGAIQLVKGLTKGTVVSVTDPVTKVISQGMIIDVMEDNYKISFGVKVIDIEEKHVTLPEAKSPSAAVLVSDNLPLTGAAGLAPPLAHAGGPSIPNAAAASGEVTPETSLKDFKAPVNKPGPDKNVAVQDNPTVPPKVAATPASAMGGMSVAVGDSKEKDSKNSWPIVSDHRITKSELVQEITVIKQKLKQNPDVPELEWRPFKFIEDTTIDVMKTYIPKIQTTQEVKLKIKEGYYNLKERIRTSYLSKVKLNNATFLKEWALTTEYLKMGIPVWQSKINSTEQTRADLAPHKLRESFQEGDANKILSDKAPGFYAFVVPLTFPFKKKIKIGPEANVATTFHPTRSEGHSALATKDNRKKISAGKVSLVKGVLFAGVVTIGEGGKVLKWTNDSGHYTISRKRAKDSGDEAGVITLEQLVAMGFPFPIDKYEDIE